MIRNTELTFRDLEIYKSFRNIHPPVTKKDLIRILQFPCIESNHDKTDILLLLEEAPDNQYVPVVRSGIFNTSNLKRINKS